MKTLLSLSCILFFAALLQGQTRLQYNLEAGERFQVLQKGEQRILQELPQGDHEILNRMQSSMELQVTNATAEYFELVLNFTRLRLHMQSSEQGILMDLDTEQKTGNAVENTRNLFQQIIDAPIYIRMAHTGEIISVEGGDELIDQLVSSARLEDEFSEELMRSTLEKDLGSQALTEGFMQLTYFYPDSKVEVGDRWRNNYKGKVAAANRWTLTSLNSSRAQIKGTSTVEFAAGENSTPIQGTQETMIEAIRDHGFARQILIKTKAEGFSAFDEMQLPIHITATTKYTLTHVQ